MKKMLHKFFVSDLHIADGSWPDDFGAKREEILATLLDRIRTDYQDECELILLGDILDFSVLDHIEVDELQAVNRCVDRVAASYPRLFKALRKFVARGNRIFYVPGNHDFPMRVHKTAVRFFHHVVPRFGSSKMLRLVSTGGYYLSESLKVYAEHGNVYDPENVHSEAGRPIGAIVADCFVRRWEHLRIEENPEEHRYPLRFAKNVRPHSHLIGYIRHLVEQGLLPAATRDWMMRQIVSLYAGTNTPLAQRFLKMLENAPAAIRDGVVEMRLKDSLPRLLAQRAQQLLAGYATNLSTKRRITITEQLDLPFNPLIVLFGHSHSVDSRIFQGNLKYINTGTWSDIVLIDENGQVKNMVDYFPYVHIKPDSDGKPEAIIRNALDHQVLDVESIKREISKAGVIME